MIPAVIPGATHIAGKKQGYLGLPIKFQNTELGTMVLSAWEPTPAEIDLLHAGAKIHIGILADQQPPLIVSIGEPPKEGQG